MAKKIIFVCAHNQTRSVTAEGVLTGEKGYEVKSRAAWRNMPRKITKADGKWADTVYVMMPGMIPVVEEVGIPRRKIKSLWIPDTYEPCTRPLIMEIKHQLAFEGIRVKKSDSQAAQDCWAVWNRKMGMPSDILRAYGISDPWASFYGGSYFPEYHAKIGATTTATEPKEEDFRRWVGERKQADEELTLRAYEEERMRRDEEERPRGMTPFSVSLRTELADYIFERSYRKKKANGTLKLAKELYDMLEATPWDDKAAQLAVDFLDVVKRK